MADLNSLLEENIHNESPEVFDGHDKFKINLNENLPLINIFNGYYQEEVIQREKELFIVKEENFKEEKKFKENNNNIFEESEESSTIFIRKSFQYNKKKKDIIDIEELKYNEINIFHNENEESDEIKKGNQIELNEEGNNYIKKENKKFIFNVFNLFNPPGINKELKITREKINEVICKGKQESIKKDRQRKLKSDDVRKKIKARFLKSLKNRINEKLICANSKEIFDFLPQCFISNITKKRNDKKILNMTFKELMSTDFFEKYKDNIKEEKKNRLNKKREMECPDKKKYLNNIKVIKYLNKSMEISKNSNYDNIQKMTFSDLFKEYLNSKEFEEDILKLIREKKEGQDYINNYIIKANDYVDYFSKSC
jgi:hypothetical protein